MLLQAGTFETAGSQALAKRVIKKARRRVQDGETKTAEGDDVVKPSPFAGFAFGPNKPSAATFGIKLSTSDKPLLADTAIPATIPTGIFGE